MDQINRVLVSFESEFGQRIRCWRSSASNFFLWRPHATFLAWGDQRHANGFRRQPVLELFKRHAVLVKNPLRTPRLDHTVAAQLSIE